MVAMNVWPTDGAAGSVATEAKWRSMARAWMASGVIFGTGSELGCTAYAHPNATIAAGAAWVDGHFCELAAPTVITCTANGLIVVRVTPATNTAELVYRDAVTQCQQTPTGVFEIPVLKITGSVNQDARAIIIPSGELRFTNVASRAAWTAAQATPPPIGLAGFVSASDSTRGAYEYRAEGWTRPWNMPWGHLAQNTWDTDQNGIGLSGADVAGSALNWTGWAGRTYRYSWQFLAKLPGSPEALTINPVIDGGTYSPPPWINFVFGSLAPQMQSGFFHFTVGSNGPKTMLIHLTPKTSVDVNAALVPSRFILEDLGPSGPAATATDAPDDEPQPAKTKTKAKPK